MKKKYLILLSVFITGVAIGCDNGDGEITLNPDTSTNENVSDSDNTGSDYYPYDKIITNTLDNYLEKTCIFDGESLNYRMLFPTDYSKDEQYPLIIVLHGTGERGDDNSAQLTYGGTFFVGDAIRSNYPAIVIFPQCPSGVRWDNKDESTSPWTWNYKSEEGTAPTELLLLLIKDLVKQGIVDSSQLYIGGISMGAMGAYEVAYRLPDYFAAGFFMSGGGNPNDIANVLSDMSFRIMHGDSDTVVAYSYATDMYDTLTAADITCKLDTYEGVGHSGWSTMFAEPDFMSWLWTYTK